MKRCAMCGAFQPLHRFYRDRRGVYSARCQSCHNVTTIRCVQCGTWFVAKRGTKLCSHACRRNYRPRTYRECEQCGELFGPLEHLRTRFCSHQCKWASQRTGRKPPSRCNTKARSAHSLVRYHVLAGHLVRPNACAECGAAGRRLEAAHFDYNDPLRIRWLCIPCHRRWDAAEPKGGVTYASTDEPLLERIARDLSFQYSNGAGTGDQSPYLIRGQREDADSCRRKK